MVCTPPARPPVLNAAWPNESVEGPRLRLLSRKVTEPGGVVLEPLTAAVRVTGLPAVLDAVDAVRDVVVAGRVTPGVVRGGRQALWRGRPACTGPSVADPPVAPTVDGKGLNTRPRGQRRLPLRQRAEWVAGQPAGQRDAGVDCVADDAVAGGDVSARVHGRRTHPSIPGVWGEGALLIQRGRAAGIADLVPPDAARGAAALARVHAVAGDQRLVVSQVTQADPVHKPISNGA